MTTDTQEVEHVAEPLAKRAEFGRLFAEFAESYPNSPPGQRHIQQYVECRQQAEANFQAAIAAAERGEDFTDFVLLKFLPYTDTAPNRAKGAWIHVAPSVIKDIKSWFEGAAWTKKEDWLKIARAILDFVQRCVDRPNQLSASCAEFAALPFVKGFQTGMLTPILNALRPEDFLLVNKKSRYGINYFAGAHFSLALRDYPRINAAGKELIARLALEMQPASGLKMRPGDAFDMFCHWLVAVKGLPSASSYWKIAPGDDAWQWDECREKGFIAIGWDPLGDVSGMNRADFNACRDELLAKHPDWNKNGVEQVWKFAHIEEGDRIVANRGTSEVLGIGTVTGPYVFVPGVRYGHRLPVQWDDITARQVDQGGWGRTLIQLNQEEFDAILQAPPVGAVGAADSGAMALAESGIQKKGAKFARWMGPVLDALRSLGGAAPANAVLRRIQERTAVPDAGFTEILKSGQTRFYNEVHWARQELVWEGLVECPERGNWALTASGKNTTLDQEAAQRIVKKWAEQHRQPVEMKADPPPFVTAKAFELLAGLHETPNKDFYAAHKEEFKEHLEEPFRQFFVQVHLKVRSEIRERMETENRVFSRILKNDYGVGGAWEFLWAAFYPKGGQRTKDVQLWASMHAGFLDAGFSFGEYSEEKQKLFLANLEKHRDSLSSLLEPRFAPLGLFYGSREDIQASAMGGTPPVTRFVDWLSQIDDLEASARVVWRKENVLAFSADELAEKVATLFDALFPLVLLATDQEPMPAIREYLQLGSGAPVVLATPSPVPPPMQPAYPLATCAAETGFEVATLESWVRAVNRKGQAIIYGPPGTGKTFVAEKLAAHLIETGNGFSELVQFHPAYSYEDFIQGLRPQTNGVGGLHYPLVPGRFLEFCKRAATREGICVLIVDEINRANLARVFGELMYLLEYRKREIPLGAGGTFSIPENVRLIGTMNTADRSIALVDHALRRRFGFIALYPRYEVLGAFHATQETGFATDGLIEQLKKVNEAIADPHYHLGLSFFLRTDLATQLPEIWQMEIEPYLEEFFFDQPEKFAQFRWENVKANVLP